jgi:hypothetical protein
VLMNGLQVPHGAQRFDENGELTDPAIAESVRALLRELAVAVGSHERHREAVAA